MIEYYTMFWIKYFNFQDRSRRSEYWYAWLMNIIIITVLAVLKAFASKLAFLYGLYGLAVLIPTLSLSVRRLHDTGRSGFWMLFWLLPAGIVELLTIFGGYSVIFFIGSHPILVSLIALIPIVVLIVFFCQDSDFDNYYGPSPKYTRTPEPEDSFYKKPQTTHVIEGGFYKKPLEEPKPERSFYNKDKIEPKEEKRSFYK